MGQSSLVYLIIETYLESGMEEFIIILSVSVHLHTTGTIGTIGDQLLDVINKEEWAKL